MTARGRPRNPDVEASVLDATLDLLSEHGYERMTVDDIAARAGTTKPTIYRRWKGKEDVATAAVAHLQAATLPQPTGDTRADLLVIVEDFRKGIQRRGGMALIGTILVEESRNPKLMQLFRERVVRPRRSAIVQILEEARSRGEFVNSADLDAATQMIVGAFYARYIAGKPLTKSNATRVVDTALRGLRR